LTVTGSGGHLAYNITTDNDNDGWRWRFVDNTADAPGVDYFIVYWSSGNYWFKGNSTSDRRIKANIQNISSDAALEKIRNVQPVTYNPKNSDGTVNTDIIKGGFIAQDLQTVIPELVTHDASIEKNAQDSENSFVPAYGVDYNGLLAYNVAATQELIKENEALKQRINNIISFLLTKFPDEEALISCI
jgi:hypothetical protein